MSVSNENVKETYNGNGSTIYWPITFEYADPEHIAVYLTDDDGVTGDKLESDYTVDEENERVIYPDPLNEELILPEGWKITLKRETPLIQNYQPSTQNFNPADIEPALDKTMMAIAEIKEESGRTIKANITEDGADYTLPSPAQGLVVGWDLTDGTRLVNYTNPGAAAAEAEAFAEAAGESAGEAEAFAEAAGESAGEAAEAEEVIKGIISHGWVPGLTAVYVSSNKIKIEGLDVTDRIQKGTRFRFKQGGGWKYGVVYADVEFSTDSIISLTGGSDYEVANAEITDFYFSNIENPVGWPHWFNWAIAFGGFSTSPTDNFARFSVLGNKVYIALRSNTAGTSNANTFTGSLPITSINITNAIWCNDIVAVDNNVFSRETATILAGSNEIRFDKNHSATGWTASGNKRVAGLTMFYEF